MIENIKTLWGLMLKETKKSVIKAMIEHGELNVTDEIYIKQTWIWSGRIPEECQSIVLGIFQNALRAQNEKINSSIEA